MLLQQGEKHSPISPSLCDYSALANNSLFYQLFISRPYTHTRALTQSHACTHARNIPAGGLETEEAENGAVCVFIVSHFSRLFIMRATSHWSEGHM